MQRAQNDRDRNPRSQKLDHARPLELAQLPLREISIDLADRTLRILSVNSS
jgi:hypothetical protein